jgi:phospholipase C
MRRGGLKSAIALAAVGGTLGSLAAAIPGFHSTAPARASRRPGRVHRQAQGIHKIKHVIVIMQENRSFDSYFGTFPGADGIPPDVCVPDPKTGGCQRPYHDWSDRNRGGPHSQSNAIRDLHRGKMNGFVGQAEAAQPCRVPDSPWCRKHGQVDVMGYHDAHEIPNYWAYAREFVLQDHMFEPSASWSLPAHLFMVSEWSALCKSANPSSCTNQDQKPGLPPDFGHLPHAQPPRELALLRLQRHGAGLREQRGRVSERPAIGSHPGNLESAPLLRDGQAGRPTRECDAA